MDNTEYGHTPSYSRWLAARMSEDKADRHQFVERRGERRKNRDPRHGNIDSYNRELEDHYPA